MPTAAGLLTSIAILLSAMNLVPTLFIDWKWQVAATCALCGINLIVWNRSQIPALSISDAAKTVSISALVIAGLAIIDTGLGFAFGQKTIVNAFWGSGPVGGVADAFLFAAGLLTGVPTLVRSVYFKYVSRQSA